MKKEATDSDRTTSVKRGPKPTLYANRTFYGATYLFDAIGEKLGIIQDLKTCFPNNYQQILSIAYYLILEENNPLSRFEKWSLFHKHPYGKDISSQRSSELFMSITEDAKQNFFKLQGRRRAEKEFWAYDTTSISSYSQTLKQVQYGMNKEHDRLPQINLALLFGEESHLPFYYRKLAGNIPDVKTIKHLLADFQTLGFSKVKLVMDRGFFSEANINAMYREHIKFLIAAKTSLSFVRNELDQVYDQLCSFENYNDNYELYSMTIPTEWHYTQDRPYKGDTIIDKRRIYVHLYYNIDKAAEDQKNFDKKLMALKQELENGKRVPENERLYKKYFMMKTTPVRGTQVNVKEDAIKAAKRYYGFFALVSNETMDSVTALELYRNKDVVEKAFGNLKERLNLRRTLVSSEQSLDGKLFVEFVALIYLSYIKKKMSTQKLYKDYTMQGLLDRLDVIECFESPGEAMRIGEILEKQKMLYSKLEVEPPTSL
jgi:transposase